MVVLKNGELEATFLPEKGMTLTSFKRGGIEVIDQSTKEGFEREAAGLGVMIGPHFHKRKPEVLPNHGDDPYTHGVGRFADWSAEATDTEIHGVLTGDDTLDGKPLKELEFQDFKMMFHAKLTPKELQLELSVVSETDSIIGIHYYYHLPKGKGKVIAKVQDKYVNQFIKENELLPLPKEWDVNSQRVMTYPLDQDTDFTFFPYPDPTKGEMLLDAETYQLITRYSSDSQENSWQLWHPKGASFVCVEPVSSQNPRRPNLSVSSINIELEIL